MRAVQQHGPSQAEERGGGAGQDTARGLQEAGGHSHSLRLLDRLRFTPPLIWIVAQAADYGQTDMQTFPPSHPARTSLGDSPNRPPAS